MSQVICCLYFLLVPALLAQVPAFPTTTLKAALSKGSADPLVLNSVANVFGPGLPISGSPGDPQGYALNIIMVDQEAMCVLQPPSKSGAVFVSRGCQGTATQNHAKGATAYVGAASWYLQNIPSGSCVATENPVLPRIVLDNGAKYDCVMGQWVLTGYTYSLHNPRTGKRHWYGAPWRWLQKMLSGLYWPDER